MNQKKELIKNTLLIAIGKCSTQVIGFLLLPLYTSILSTTEYGSYDLLNTLSIFIIPFVTLLMEEAMFRFLIDSKNNKEKGVIVTQTVILTLFNMLIGSILIFIVGSIFKYDYTMYLILFVFASILSTLAGSLCRGQGLFKLYSLFAFLSSLFTLILNVLFIAVFRMGVIGLFLAYFIGNATVSIWLLLKLKVLKLVSFKKINSKQMKEMLKYSLPLVPNSISWITINLSDRIIISSVLGIAANGIYAIANKFSTIVNTFYSFFYMAWKEAASKAIKKDDKDLFYNSIYINLKHLLLGVSIGMIAFLPYVFPILINKNYSAAYNYVPILLIAIYFSNISSFCGGIFAAYKDTNTMGISTIIAAIVNVTINLSLVHFIGLYAAAISTLASTFIVCIYRMTKMKKFLKLNKDKYTIFNIIVFGTVIGTYYSNNQLLFVLGAILGTLYAIFLNRSIISTILKKITRKKTTD